MRLLTADKTAKLLILHCQFLLTLQTAFWLCNSELISLYKLINIYLNNSCKIIRLLIYIK